jgi:hypothetical protein
MKVPSPGVRRESRLLEDQMPEIFVNDVLQEIDPAPQTWGDVLEVLDARVTSEGAVLAAARFDGVEEVAFRDPAAVRRALSSIGRVDVETAEPGAFLRRCLLEAVEPLRAAATSAQVLAEHYRRYDLAKGHQGATALASDLRALALIVLGATQSAGVESAVVVDASRLNAQVGELIVVLDALLAAQASEDWVTVADVLEYDLEPAIGRWAALLASAAGDAA